MAVFPRVSAKDVAPQAAGRAGPPRVSSGWTSYVASPRSTEKNVAVLVHN